MLSLLSLMSLLASSWAFLNLISSTSSINCFLSSACRFLWTARDFKLSASMSCIFFLSSSTTLSLSFSFSSCSRLICAFWISSSSFIFWSSFCIFSFISSSFLLFSSFCLLSTSNFFAFSSSFSLIFRKVSAISSCILLCFFPSSFTLEMAGVLSSSACFLFLSSYSFS